MRNEEREQCLLIKKAIVGRLISKDEKGKKIMNPALEDTGIRALAAALKNVQDMLYRSYGIVDANISMHLVEGSYEDRIKKIRAERGLPEEPENQVFY
jgi:hypothetical protein